jgi:hypothetical protein
LSPAKLQRSVFQLYFHWFFPLSHYSTDWRWFELVFALFPALLHSVVKVIYLLHFVEEFVFGLFVD